MRTPIRGRVGMTPSAQARALDVVARLVTVMQSDPVYRDLYLRRARVIFEGTCPGPELGKLRELEGWLQQRERETREAVLKGEWQHVQQLVAEIVSVRRTLDAKRTEIELAAKVYDAGDVPVDPFSPGLAMLVPGRPDLATLLDSVRDGLAALERLDPDGVALYASRRRYFEALLIAPRTHGQPAPTVDAGQAVVEALEDLRRGAIEELGVLARRMLSRSAGATTVGEDALRDRLGVLAQLAAPFPGEAVSRARALGLVAVTLPAEPDVADYVRRVAWTPDFARPELRQGGATWSEAARVEAARADPVLRNFRETARETLVLFALHPYLNSAGARYLPRPVEETVLVEEFAESEDPSPASPLLEALGLRRRQGLARVEIEAALVSTAPDVLERELGLDPLQYQLVCVPSDVYNRAGAALSWGRLPRWTHFDGYQVLRTAHLRALVGGDVRYGGRADLASIAREDARDNVIVRLAVVRRERLLGRWG